MQDLSGMDRLHPHNDLSPKCGSLVRPEMTKKETLTANAVNYLEPTEKEPTSAESRVYESQRMVDLLMSNQTVKIKVRRAIDRAQRDPERATQARQKIIDATNVVNKRSKVMNSVRKNQENWNATISGDQEAAVLNLQTVFVTENTFAALNDQESRSAHLAYFNYYTALGSDRKWDLNSGEG